MLPCPRLTKVLASIPALAPERDSLLVIYDVKMSGYSGQRQPPVLDSQDLMTKLTSLWKTRPFKDRVLVFDGRQATSNTIKLALSSSLPSSVKGAPTSEFVVHYAEDQDHVSQLETCHVMMPEECPLPTPPRRQNINFKAGTTTGNVIGIVGRDSDPWTVPVGMLKTLMPRAQDVQQGGQGDPSVVPLAPWGPPKAFYEEVLHRYMPAGVLDLTCLTPALAEACKPRGIPYVGCCPSRAHAALVLKRLELLNFEAMAAEGTSSFKKELADVLAELASDVGQEEKDPEDEHGGEPQEGGGKKKKRAASKPKAKGKGQKKRRKAAAAGESEEEVEDEEAEAEGEDDGLDDLMN